MTEKSTEILEKAALIFMRYGIKSVTMDDIARELVISKKTLYKFFTDKNDLVRQIIESKLEFNRQECCMSQEHSENAIDAMFLINRTVRRQFANIHPSVFYDLQKYHQDAWRLLEIYRNEFIRGEIEENMTRGISEGFYRSNVDIPVTATFYMILIDRIISGELVIEQHFKYDTLFIELMRYHIRAIASEKGINYLIERIKQEEK